MPNSCVGLRAVGTLQPFAFDGRSVRIVLIDGEPWFVAKDVCEVLGYANHNDAVSRHCRGVAKYYPLPTAGGVQDVRLISRPDTYRLIAGSTLPEAERFERWIFEEVLPSIHETGSYGLAETPEQKLLAGVLWLQAKCEDQAKQLAEAAPKVAHYDAFADATGRYGLQQAARIMGQGPNTWIKELEMKGYLFRQGGVLVPRAEYIDRGWFEVKEVLVDGKAYCQTYVTTKGLQYFARPYAQQSLMLS